MVQETQSKTGQTTEQEGLNEQEIHEVAPEHSHGEIEAEIEQEMEEEGKFEFSTDSIARDLVEHIEAHGGTREGGLLARFILRQTLKTVLLYKIAVVKRMTRNPLLKRKLQIAARRGPRAVNRLVGVAVLAAMPRPFRRVARKLVALAIFASFRQIARNAGLGLNEIDVAELGSDPSDTHYAS